MTPIPDGSGHRDTPGPPAPVVVVGEALIDLLPRPQLRDDATLATVMLEAVPGGSPANVAVGLVRQGVPTRFAGRFATGGLGPWRKSSLQREGVDLTLSVDATEPATLALVTFDNQGRATYDFYGRDTADWHWRPGELPDPQGFQAAAVHIGSLATMVSPGAEQLSRWLAAVRSRNDIVVSYDPNVRLGVFGDEASYRESVADILPHVHLVKASEEDLAVLWPSQPVVEIARRWLDNMPGPDIVVITRGSHGSVALHRDGRCLEQPGSPATVVDTVGAGDAFTSGFLARLWSTGYLTPDALAAIDSGVVRDALAYANRVAALTCERPGADPPYAAEMHSHAATLPY
jgi:fructokinase